MLIRVIYASQAAVPFSASELQSLLAVARSANAGIGVTGMLLLVEQSFFQVLEGQDAVVVELYEKIAADPRHRRIVKIIEEPIAHRDFAAWTMGFAGMQRAELARIEGLNDFFSTGRCFTELKAGRARTLLEAFKQGRWRQGMAA